MAAPIKCHAEACGHRWIHSIDDPDGQVTCPECGSTNVKVDRSVFRSDS